MPSIFMCHSSVDKPFVRRLAGQLGAYGIKCWIDEAEMNIGDSLFHMIGKAIDSSDFLAAVLSAASIESRWVRKELEIALAREISQDKVVVLPILAETISETQVPPFLRSKVWADFSREEGYPSALMKVVKATGVSESDLLDRRYSRCVWHRLEHLLVLHDDEGKHATWTKTTTATPLRTDIVTWQDEQIHSSGSTTILKSTPGTIVNVRDEGGVLSATTEFDEPLPQGERFSRTLVVELGQAFLADRELISWIPIAEFHRMQFCVQVPRSRPFIGLPIGSVYYGTDKEQIQKLDVADSGTRVTWNIEYPQAGVKYLLEWEW